MRGCFPSSCHAFPLAAPSLHTGMCSVSRGTFTTCLGIFTLSGKGLKAAPQAEGDACAALAFKSAPTDAVPIVSQEVAGT